jgi:hypothetical protein
MRRYSSRRQGLDREFINQKLKGAISYDRIAGFFRSSILEVAGEALLVQGKMQVRVLPDEVFGLIHGKAGVKQELSPTLMAAKLVF